MPRKKLLKIKVPRSLGCKQAMRVISYELVRTPRNVRYAGVRVFKDYLVFKYEYF